MSEAKAWKLLDEIRKCYQEILGSQLIGIYAHGSLAFGCFSWERSDIDFLVVVEEKPTLEQKIALIQTLLERNHEAPDKGFEMSVVLKENAVCSGIRRRMNCIFPMLISKDAGKTSDSIART